MGRTRRQSHIVRLFALALCLLLVTAVLPGRAYALSGTTGGLSWSLTGGTLTISGSGAMPDYTDANMPPWYDSATAINRIVVKEGVTTVGELAFYGCSTAVRASLPSSVTAIGDRAFKNCTSMTYVNLPEGLVSIGEAAFESCTALNGILLPESLRTIENYAFERCTALTSIVIPAGVTDLGMVAFYNCTGLTRAEIRCPIEKLPDWFFYGCTALSEVVLPETVTRTGNQAFHNCESLSTVYYSGAASEIISDALLADETTRYAVVSSDGGSVSSAASSTTFDAETSTSTTIAVTQTDGAVITETTQTSYTYTVNGTDATLEEAMTAVETEEVEVTKETSTSISATVSGSDGWQEVAEASKDVVKRSDGDSVTVEVQLTGSTVSGGDLSGLAGVDAELAVSTSEGCIWVIDTARQSAGSFGSGEIDLAFSVELLETDVKGIDSSTVYQLNFASDINFDVVVGVPLKVGNAYQYATIYAKSTSGVTELSSAVVDESGYAWLPVSQLDQKKEYYVGINVEGADTANALVPDSMLESYGVDYIETLTDASGTQYQVGARESRWGITGKQFAIYAAIAIGAVVLIVTGVMITINKINRSKAKYAAMAEADAAADYDIDEDALRLQVMQEMLEEVRREKEDG